MGKYDEQISKAKILLTELLANSFNASDSTSPLKLRKCIDRLYADMPTIETKNRAGFLTQFVDAMFETRDDKIFEDTLKEFVNDTAQLELCKNCRCASCVLIESSCCCQGCVYGAYVTSCEGGNGIERREVQRGTVSLKGRPVVAFEYNRLTKQNTAYALNKNGNEEKIQL